MMIDQDKVDEIKKNQPLTFSDALVLLKYNMKVRRQNWKNIIFLKIKKPSKVNDGTSREATFYAEAGDLSSDNFELKAEDILAEDWIFVA